MSDNASPRSILNDDDDKRTAHWVAIEAKKARLSGFTLILLGLSVSFGGGAAVAALSTGRAVAILPAMVIVMALMAQHAYYLHQVRLFRALGQDVDGGYVRFRCMSVAPYRATVTYWTALRNWRVWSVHASMLAMLTTSGIAVL